MAKDMGDENNLKISEAAPKADEQKTFSVQKNRKSKPLRTRAKTQMLVAA